MFRLPVSGLPVVVHQPTGMEDLLLQEARTLDLRFALTLLGRVVRVHDDATVNLSELTVTDFEALLLLLRRAVLGDLVRAETNCNAPGCGARVDVSFGIGEYLASQKLRTPRGVERSEADGWFRLADQDVRFRLPNCGDLSAVDSQPRPEHEFILRCVEPADVPAALRRRIERAMEALAPRLSRTLSGECPECQVNMDFYFDVREFVLRELRDHAAPIYQEVHLLALYYKWPEQHILALPGKRRTHYAEALRNQGSAA
jgi:hypothetical protein